MVTKDIDDFIKEGLAIRKGAYYYEIVDGKEVMLAKSKEEATKAILQKSSQNSVAAIDPESPRNANNSTATAPAAPKTSKETLESGSTATAPAAPKKNPQKKDGEVDYYEY